MKISYELMLQATPQDLETLEVNGFVKEVERRLCKKPTKPARGNSGMFTYKEAAHYSWPNYIRWFFKENPCAEVICCHVLYKKTRRIYYAYKKETQMIIVSTLLRRNPPDVGVTSGQKSCTKIIYIVLQTSVGLF